MQKSTLYLVVIGIIAVVIVAVTGEYFAYKYYSLLAVQQTSNVTAAQTPTSQASSAKEVISFDFETPLATGDIGQDNTVNITVPAGTDVTKLTPTIEVSPNATISPASGTVQDFTNPVAYLVTAQDNSTQTYIVTVNVAKSSEAFITSFKLSGFNPEIIGAINNTQHTVYAVVPDGTDVTKLMPIITVSDNATYTPTTSAAYTDFTNPVMYAVTAQDGTTQDYVITVVTESNSG